jgi:hypothetical protein
VKIRIILGALVLLMSGQARADLIVWTYEASVNSEFNDLLNIDGEVVTISFVFDDTNVWQQVGNDLYFSPESWAASITGGHSVTLNTSMPVAKHADSCCGYMVEEIGSDSYIDLIVDGNLTLMSGNGIASDLIPLAGDNLLVGHLAKSISSYTFFEYIDSNAELAKYNFSNATITVSSFPALATLINGGFEIPLVNGEYEHRNDDELPGWTLFSTYKGTVHFDTDYAAVSEGSQAVQIEVPGDWISQSFVTEVGQTYLVSFDLSAFPRYGGPNLGFTPCNPYCDSILGVSVGSESEVFNGSSEEYVTHTLLFTADSTVSTLKFENPYILDINDEWGNYPHLDNVTITPVSTHVTIDIKPGSDPNSINPKSKGVIPVAVLGSMDFDATQVYPAKVTFGPHEAIPAHNGHVEDVDDDGYMDMMFHFKTEETGIVCGDTEATLMGETFGGIQLTGIDTLKTVGCEDTVSDVSEGKKGSGAMNWMMLIGLSLLGLLGFNIRRNASL